MIIEIFPLLQSEDYQKTETKITIVDVAWRSKHNKHTQSSATYKHRLQMIGSSALRLSSHLSFLDSNYPAIPPQVSLHHPLTCAISSIPFHLLFFLFLLLHPMDLSDHDSGRTPWPTFLNHFWSCEVDLACVCSGTIGLLIVIGQPWKKK